MSGTADKEGPPVIPPKGRSPSPDDGLLREEPLETESKPTTKSTDATAVPTGTAPSATSQTATAPPTLDDENPPPKPPRPVSQFEQNVATLAEAFPDVDVGVIKAVLTASRNQVEPAFNALLGMSDPTAAAEFEEAPPPQPPRPRQPQATRDLRGPEHYNPASVYHEEPSHKTSTSATQLESDEIYARQLAEHYGAVPTERTRQGRGGYGNYPEQRRRQQGSDDDDDRERNFFDDELPAIQENLRKGFLDTQKKFNQFISDVGKKFAGEEEDEQPPNRPARGPRPPGQGGQGGQPQYPQRYSSRYDADPEVLQGDFSHLELRDNTEEPRRTRPVANPNLFDSSSPQATTPGGRKVGFANQSEEDLYRPSGPAARSGPPASALRGGANDSATGGTATSTGSKWAPLTSVEPTPLTNDPFQLADSDDEHDNIQTTAAKTGPQESGTKTTTK